MDAPTRHPTPPPGSADPVDASLGNPLQSPDSPFTTVVAQRRIMKASGLGSPVRRSPRLSCLPPPLPPVESHDTQDSNESSGDESESVSDIPLHLFRDKTPENDDFPPDEPSSVLANRVMRAHDNPSPPPQDLAHPGVNYVPGQDGRFPLPNVSVPPSPFRSVNLLERLHQFPNPLFVPSYSHRSAPSGVRPDMSEPGVIPPRGYISPGSSSPLVVSAPMECIPHEDLASADTIPSSSTRCTIDGLPRLSHHVCELANLVDDTVIDMPSPGLHGQSSIITSPLESEVRSSPPIQVVDPSSDPAAPSASDDLPRGLLPLSERQYNHSRPSLLPLDAKSPSSDLSDENSQATSGAETLVPGRKDNNMTELSSMDNDPPSLSVEQETKCRTTSKREVDANSLQRLVPLPLHSTDMLVMCIPSRRTPLVEQTTPPSCPCHSNRSSETPPRTPMPSVLHPDFSRTSVQRPVIASTPVRANSARKLNSPSEFLLEVDNTHRTPAQRVPIETAFARGNSSFQRKAQLSAGSQSRPELFPTIRAPAFSRPVLDDSSRSPAKRVPIAESVISPTRNYQTQNSPTRLSLRARSASVEPRPVGTILARSRSVEPCATASKTDNYGKIRESVFPMVPIPPRAGFKLPFPLSSGQKWSSDLPPSIPEEHENAEIGNSGIDATQSKPMLGNKMSQLRQLPTNSRIPRIGNKPYTRPPKNGKTTVNTTSGSTARAPRIPPSQLNCMNSGVGNSNAGVSSTQGAKDQHLTGSLKRKRAAEAMATPQPVMIRQVVPGILSEKYAPKAAKLPSQVHALKESSPLKVPQLPKFRKVVDGMLSARYTQAKANPLQTELLDSTSLPPSPLSELSSSSDEGSCDGQLSTAHSPAVTESKTSDNLQTNVNAPVEEPSMYSSPHQDVDGDKLSSRPRRTPRTRKPAQQQYVLDVFSANTTSRPPQARRKPQPRAEGDCFMGMSATALKALTSSNTTKNEQTVVVLATEVIRKEGLRPESPTVKARTILQKQRDERDMRRRERAQKKAQMVEEGSGDREAEKLNELSDGAPLDARAHQEEDGCAMLQKHRRGPGDEEDYETPERPEHLIEPLRLDGVERKGRPVKQVKWHRGLSTAVYLDEVDPKPKSIPKNLVMRGCLAPTSKNLPLDSLGNMVDAATRPFPELVAEHIVVKRYLYDNDIEPEPIPAKITRSRSKKSKS